MLPRPQLADKFRAGPKGHPLVEFVLVGAMTTFDLAIGLRTAGWDVPVGDAEIVQMPGEISAPFGAVVSLNPPDCRRKRLADLIYEVNGGLDGVVVVDLEDAIAGGFVDGGELVEPA